MTYLEVSDLMMTKQAFKFKAPNFRFRRPNFNWLNKWFRNEPKKVQRHRTVVVEPIAEYTPRYEIARPKQVGGTGTINPPVRVGRGARKGAEKKVFKPTFKDRIRQGYDKTKQYVKQNPKKALAATGAGLTAVTVPTVAYKKGKSTGKQEGMKQGIQAGRQQGIQEARAQQKSAPKQPGTMDNFLKELNSQTGWTVGGAGIGALLGTAFGSDPASRLLGAIVGGGGLAVAGNLLYKHLNKKKNNA